MQFVSVYFIQVYSELEQGSQVKGCEDKSREETSLCFHLLVTSVALPQCIAEIVQLMWSI